MADVDINDFITKAQNSQVPEDVIRKVLLEKGHTEEEITAALRTPEVPLDADLMQTLTPPGSFSTPPISTGTGEVPPSQFSKTQGANKVLAMGAEYVLPAAVTMMMPESLLATFGTKAAPYVQAGVSAAATGAGLLAARQLQGHDPIGEQFREAGSAMAADVAVNLALSPMGRMAAGKLFKTKTVPKDVTGLHNMAKDAQAVLEEAGGSLTLGSMEGTSSNLAKQIEGFLRGSFVGKGKFKAQDELNINSVEEIYSGFMKQVSDSTDDVRFGRVLQSLMIGKEDPVTGKIVRGGIDGWVADTKDRLYDMARKLYVGKGINVDVSSTYKAMERFKDAPEFEKAFSIISPYLQEGENILTELPVEDAIMLKRELNYAIKAVPQKRKGDFNAMAGQIDNLQNEIYTSLATHSDDAGAAYHLAESFTKTAAEIHEQAFYKTLTNTLAKKPTSVLSYIESAQNSEDALRQLERGWSFAETGFQGKLARAGVEAAKIPPFEEAVMRPLRFDILNKAYDSASGAFNAGGIQDAIKPYSESTKVRLFGQNYEDRLEKIANAGKYLVDYKFPDKIMPTLVEAGLLSSTAYGAATGSIGAAGKAAKTLAAVLFIDSSLSNMFTNTKFVNRIIEGLNQGPGDGRFATALYNLAATGLVEYKKMKESNPQALKFYGIEGYTERENKKMADSTPATLPLIPVGMKSGPPML